MVRASPPGGPAGCGTGPPPPREHPTLGAGIPRPDPPPPPAGAALPGRRCALGGAGKLLLLGHRSGTAGTAALRRGSCSPAARPPAAVGAERGGEAAPLPPCAAPAPARGEPAAGPEAAARRPCYLTGTGAGGGRRSCPAAPAAQRRCSGEGGLRWGGGGGEGECPRCQGDGSSGSSGSRGAPGHRAALPPALGSA